jgi:hypothetical protein
MLDTAAYNPLIPAIMGEARKAAPGIKLGDTALFSAAGAAFNVATTGVSSDAESATAQQRILCAIYGAQSDGQQGMTAGEYSATKLAVKAAVQELFPVTTYGALAFPLQVLWGDVVNAIGEGDSRAITSGLARLADEDCGCNGGGTAYDWEYVFDFTVDQQGFSSPGALYVPGTGWRGTDGFDPDGDEMSVHLETLMEADTEGIVTELEYYITTAEWKVSSAGYQTTEDRTYVRISVGSGAFKIEDGLADELDALGPGPLSYVLRYVPNKTYNNDATPSEFQVNFSAHAGKMADGAPDSNRTWLHKIVVRGVGNPPLTAV